MDSAIEMENHRLTDGLKEKIHSLKSLSIDIGAEVREQNGMLKNVDNEFDGVGGILVKAMDKVKKISSVAQKHVALFLALFSFVIFFFLRMLFFN